MFRLVFGVLVGSGFWLGLGQTWYNRVKLIDTICLVSVGRRYDFIIEFDIGQKILNSKAFIDSYASLSYLALP